MMGMLGIDSIVEIVIVAKLIKIFSLR